MVEEVHSLEMRQKNKTSANGSSNCATTDEQHQPPSSSRTNPLSSPQFQIASVCRNQNSVTEGIHEELTTSMRNHIQGGPVNFVYHGMSNNQHVAGGAGVAAAAGGNGVSLTLGLHQDSSGVCFPEPLPLNVARRFGLDECNDAYLMSSFGGQERQFGKDTSCGLRWCVLIRLPLLFPYNTCRLLSLSLSSSLRKKAPAAAVVLVTEEEEEEEEGAQDGEEKR
ncbi:hypothetical protein B296_00016614 [Ensete ventricosum]|uniref:Uncharacterized protein n=1 Tax=Ensete ventricosum TaxID=4639 RepID=A0A426Y7J6_ENSVE|nr:hypothetical protein B296_00016614 [Ensete ventricosum]